MKKIKRYITGTEPTKAFARSPESLRHQFIILFTIAGSTEVHEFKTWQTGPLDALHELHTYLQCEKEFTPEDYAITHLERIAMAAYELPPGKNPDVRRPPKIDVSLHTLPFPFFVEGSR